MDLGEHMGGEPNTELSQPRESSYENSPVFKHDRLQLREPEEDDTFVEQEPGSPCTSTEAEDHYEVSEDGNRQGNHGQASDDQGNDDLDFSERSAGNNEDSQSDIEYVTLLQHELDQETLNDEDLEGDGDEPDNNRDQKGPSPGCTPCKTLRKRLDRLENRLASMNKIVASKNERLSLLLNRSRSLIQKLEGRGEELRHLKATLRRYNINPDSGTRVRGVVNPTAAARMASGALENNLREFYSSSSNSQDNIDDEGWELVWKAQYKQNNIPINLMLLHPDIRLRKPDNLPDDEPVSSRNLGVSRPVAHFTRPPLRADFEGFDKFLPETILVNILTKVLFFSQQVVHIFSRLDPFEPPASLQSARRPPGRIYLSDGEHTSISLTHDTISPGRLLAPLRVNRRWHFYGAHIFYGNNTFAFSSFGEFGQFCKGIGKARLQRIAHVELHWQGGSCVHFAEQDANKDRNKSKDYRSLPLAHLPEMRRLDTLVIFIDETSSGRVRRPWEDPGTVQFAEYVTAGQPNYRLTRALRVCRGWDYLHMLRNLSWIRLYDTMKMNITHQRSSSAVRDLSAEMDLQRTARMKNTPGKAAKCRLSRLLPLCPPTRGKWSPGNDDFKLILRAIVNDPSKREWENSLDEDVDVSEAGASEIEASEDVIRDDGSDEGEDGEAEDDSGDEDIRRTQTERFVFDLSTTATWFKSEGRGQPSAPQEVIVIESDSEGSDMDIIEIPRPRTLRSESITRFQNRRSTTSGLSSGLFMTPGPDEVSTTASTGNSIRSSPIVDLNGLGIKRSASHDLVETKKRKITADI